MRVARASVNVEIVVVDGFVDEDEVLATIVIDVANPRRIAFGNSTEDGEVARVGTADIE